MKFFDGVYDRVKHFVFVDVQKALVVFCYAVRKDFLQILSDNPDPRSFCFVILEREMFDVDFVDFIKS